jgi:HEPN domain-containing protein
MTSAELAKRWVQKAESDLKIGIDEMGTDSPATDMVCFHMQQCVEKYLKAFLTLMQQRFRRTHDIAELIELCKQFDPSFDVLYQAQVDALTSYGVEIRYPDNFYLPDMAETQNAISLALQARDFIRGKLIEHGLRLD